MDNDLFNDLCNYFEGDKISNARIFRYSPELTERLKGKPIVKKEKRMCLKDKTKVCDLCHYCDIDISQPNY